MAILKERFGPLAPKFYPRAQGAAWRRVPADLRGLGTNGQLPARFGPLAPQYYAPTPVVPGLGDLFNDIVGSIVPGWDDRPQWMKDVKVTVKPADVANFAQRVFPKQAAAVQKAVKDVGAAAAPYAKEWAAFYARRRAGEVAGQVGEFIQSPMGLGTIAVVGVVLLMVFMQPGRKRTR